MGVVPVQGHPAKPPVTEPRQPHSPGMLGPPQLSSGVEGRVGASPWRTVWLTGGGQAGGMSTVVCSGFLAVLAELVWVLLGLVTIRLFSGVLRGPGLDGFPGLLGIRRLAVFWGLVAMAGGASMGPGSVLFPILAGLWGRPVWPRPAWGPADSAVASLLFFMLSMSSASGGSWRPRSCWIGRVVDRLGPDRETWFSLRKAGRQKRTQNRVRIIEGPFPDPA